MIDGIIEIDSERAKEFGFTSELYSPDSYLWKDGERVLISLITCKQEGQGHLSRLFKNIKEKGFRVAVPTPLGKMQTILERKGFVPTWEGETEIWNEM